MNSAAASLTIATNQTLTVNGPATLTQGQLSLPGGTLAGTGTLTIANKASVPASGNASTINNPITQNGTLTVQATGDAQGLLTLAKDLTNNGTIQFTVPANNKRAVGLEIN